MRTDKGLDRSFRGSEAWGATSFSENDPLSLSVAALSRQSRRSGIKHYSNSISGHEQNKLFLNQGGTSFLDASTVSGVDSDDDGRCFVIWDYDRDGRQDLALVNANAPLLTLFRNRMGEISGTHAGRVLAFRFVGANRSPEPRPGTSPRDGFGARVIVQAGGQTIHREFRCGTGFAAQNGPVLLVGVGDVPRVDRVTVRWPSGAEAALSDVEAGQLLVAYEDPSASPDASGLERRPYARLGGPIGAAAPTANAAVLDLTAVAPAASSDEVRLYVSMATWCAACAKQLPRLSRLREQFGGRRVRLFGVPVDEEDDGAKLAEYVAKKAPAYELLSALTPEARARFTKATKRLLPQEVLPSTIATDAHGRVLGAWTGVPTVSDIETLLSRARGDG